MGNALIVTVRQILYRNLTPGLETQKVRSHWPRLPEVFFQEIDTNCFFVTFGENSSAVSLDQTGFSHSSISHNHDLEQNQKKQSMKCIASLLVLV